MNRTSLTQLLLGFSILLVLSGCYYNGDNQGGDRIEGEGPIRKKTLELSELNGIIIKNSADVYLSRGNEQKVTVEAQENIIKNLDTSVTNGVWSIRNLRPVWRMEPISVYITLPEFKLLKISGSGNLVAEDHFTNLKDVELVISGSGDAELRMDCDDLYAKISGSGGVRLEGKCERADFTISGSGSFRAPDFTIEKARALVSGSGSMNIYVKEDLDARISGSGSIQYHGKPNVTSKTSGSGHIYSR